jgi:hypothetical protein
MEPPPNAPDSPPPLPEWRRTKMVMEMLDRKNIASIMYFRISNILPPISKEVFYHREHIVRRADFNDAFLGKSCKS